MPPKAFDDRRTREVARLAPHLLVPTAPRSSTLHHDSALLAFAQLAAYRLDVARCLVSFFDHSHQYVVAEATRTSRLAAATPEQRQDDDIWLGGTAIPRSQGPCEHVLVAADHEAQTNADHLPVSIVTDLALDDRYCDGAGICDAPYNRFYAGIALRSSNGIIVGILCVFDPEPRPAGLQDAQLDCLRTLATIISAYLEYGDSHRALQRTERMVQGLEAFVNGNDGMSCTPQTKPKQQDSQIQNRVTCSLPEPVPEVPTVPTFEHAGEINHALDHAPEETAVASPPRPVMTPIQPPSLPESSVPSGIDEHNAYPGSQKTDSAASVARSLRSTIINSTDDITQTSHPREISNIFNRAAGIVRRSLDVAGVIFLDASVRSYGSLISGTDDDTESIRPIPVQDFVEEGQSLPQVGHGTDNGGSPCRTLGWSSAATRAVHGATTHAPVSPHANMSERALQKLIKRHPLGRVFDFDHSQGAAQAPEYTDHFHTAEQHDHDHGPTSPHAELSDNGEPGSILAMFPGATSVALVPLWDTRRERWFGASLIWTQAPARSFTTRGEISYLRAFATTIMAEVDRVRATTDEVSKSNLLGSLSHELQSPLHGIVSAIDLLYDTELDVFQGDLLQAMDACGRTLLDVIDHLLDYSKMSKLTRGTRKLAAPGLPDKEQQEGLGQDRYSAFRSQVRTLSYIVDLDALVEETVESMFTLQMTQPRVKEPGKSRYDARQYDTAFMTQRSNTNEELGRHSDVSIYLDMDLEMLWSGRMEAGAIRRIIMNLLGNSLKYTQSGFIFVQLTQEVPPNKNQDQVIVQLTVNDSGIGIGHEFLQHHAFEPFTQENALSQGTGMGLSLVSQIVPALGGSIKMESQPGHGTCATVRLPFRLSPAVNEPISQFAQNVTALKGLRVLLRGFKETATTIGIAPKSLPVELDLLQKMCTSWLQLDCMSSRDKDIRPDVIVCTAETTYDTLLATEQYSLPVVVVCHNALIAHSLWLKSREVDEQGPFEFISQPIGPRKLATAMILALGRFSKTRVADLVRAEAICNTTEKNTNSSRFATPLATPAAQTPQRDSWLDGHTPTHLMPDPGSEMPMCDVEPPLSKLSISTPEIDSRMPCDQTEVGGAHQERNEILLVDDNKINLQILVSFMKKLKRPYQIATNGLEALHAYTAHPTRFSHILMDISMPVMDGLESTRRIRSHEAERLATITATADHEKPLPPVKIAALTGLVSAEAQQEAYASGVDLYMTKPVRFKELAAVLLDGQTTTNTKRDITT